MKGRFFFFKYSDSFFRFIEFSSAFFSFKQKSMFMSFLFTSIETNCLSRRQKKTHLDYTFCFHP